jgi:hypothetical protein
MYKPFFASSNFVELAIFGLVLFLSIFLLVLFRTWVFKTRKDYESTAAMPLADERHEIATNKR